MSQVTPGGGVLKLTLSRKGLLKITTEAQNRRPDPSQTTVKTVYDPTKEKDPLQGGENIKAKTTFRRGESLGDPKIKPRKAPNDKEVRTSLKMGVQLGKLTRVVVVILMEMGDQIGVRNHLESGIGHQMGLEE